MKTLIAIILGTLFSQSALAYNYFNGIKLDLAGTLPHLNSLNVTRFSTQGTCARIGENASAPATYPRNAPMEVGVYSLGGTLLKSVKTTCLANGTWIAPAMDLSAVADGRLQVKAKIFSMGQSIFMESNALVTKDTVPPKMALSAPISPATISKASGTKVTVTGICEVNHRLVVLRIDRAISASPLPRTTTWCVNGKFTLTQELAGEPDGVVALSLFQRDDLGNITLQALNILKDTTAPALTFNQLPYVRISNVNSIELSGSCSEENRSVIIGGAISAATTCANQKWKHVLSAASLPDGLLRFIAHQSDSVGNGMNREMYVKKDTVAPTLSAIAPSTISISTVGSVSISGTCSESGRYVALAGAVSGQTLCDDGKWQISHLDLGSVADGSLKITVAHTDSVLNLITQDLAILKDTVAPTLTILKPASNGQIVTDAFAPVFSLGGTCSEVGQTISVSGNTSGETKCDEKGNWNLPLDISKLSIGLAALNILYKDAVGNTSKNMRTVVRTLSCGGKPFARVGNQEYCFNTNLSRAEYAAKERAYIAKLKGDKCSFRPSVQGFTPPVAADFDGPINLGDSSVFSNLARGRMYLNGNLHLDNVTDTGFTGSDLYAKTISNSYLKDLANLHANHLISSRAEGTIEDFFLWGTIKDSVLSGNFTDAYIYGSISGTELNTEFSDIYSPFGRVLASNFIADKLNLDVGGIIHSSCFTGNELNIESSDRVGLLTGVGDTPIFKASGSQPTLNLRSDEGINAFIEGYNNAAVSVDATFGGLRLYVSNSNIMPTIDAWSWESQDYIILNNSQMMHEEDSNELSIDAGNASGSRGHSAQIFSGSGFGRPDQTLGKVHLEEIMVDGIPVLKLTE